DARGLRFQGVGEPADRDPTRRGPDRTAGRRPGRGVLEVDVVLGARGPGGESPEALADRAVALVTEPFAALGAEALARVRLAGTPGTEPGHTPPLVREPLILPGQFVSAHLEPPRHPGASSRF